MLPVAWFPWLKKGTKIIAVSCTAVSCTVCAIFQVSASLKLEVYVQDYRESFSISRSNICYDEFPG